MKRTLLLWAVFNAIFVFGQTDHPPKKKFGFRAGVNMTDLKIYSYNYYDPANGIYATTTAYGSFFGDFRLSDRLSLQPELGLTFSDDMTFVEVPVYLNYHFSDKLIGFFGPKMSYLTDQNYYRSIFNTRSAFSFDIGLRYNITKRFFLDATYVLPLSSQKQTHLQTFNTTEYSRQEIRFGLGYRF